MTFYYATASFCSRLLRTSLFLRAYFALVLLCFLLLLLFHDSYCYHFITLLLHVACGLCNPSNSRCRRRTAAAFWLIFHNSSFFISSRCFPISSSVSTFICQVSVSILIWSDYIRTRYPSSVLNSQPIQRPGPIYSTLLKRRVTCFRIVLHP